MEIIKVENVSFTYPNRTTDALCNINLSIQSGEFITLCGKSGCGKTTLLRLLKSSLAPFGSFSGNIFFDGTALNGIDSKEQAAKIGFVMQNPDNQIVTDKVWHELAFGLESLGYSTSEIRARVSEMASFFGIETWFYQNVAELSGGQKQLLNLASVMVMQPSVLILDEPTSQLDPIAATEFLNTVEKINRELGTTVILSEHRLEEAFPISDRVIVMDDGKIIADETPKKVGEMLTSSQHDMCLALPSPMRIHGAVNNQLDCPLTVREGRAWLLDYAKTNSVNPDLIPNFSQKNAFSETVLEIKNAFFRYEKESPDVIKNLSVAIKKGEFFVIVGGNGTGKTTALSLLAGLLKPYRGEVLLNGTSVSNIKNLYGEILGVLPQNPQSIFVKKTVFSDLLEILSDKKLAYEKKESLVRQMAALCRIEDLLECHPYDLSGGEQQRAALAKVLLNTPQILLLDEPTKGLDAHFKQIFAEILSDLKQNGVTVIMVSHDIEFCAKYADRCALFFDGTITSCGTPREFFCGKNFYTTSANRMARTILPKAVLTEDIILACGGNIPKQEKKSPSMILPKTELKPELSPKETKKQSPFRMIFGSIFAVLFVLTTILYQVDADFLSSFKFDFYGVDAFQILSILEIAIAFYCFFPQKESALESVQQPRSNRKLSRRTLVATLLILVAIPLTLYIGIHFFGSRKYYLVSLLIILETMVPFCMVFESRKPQARELVTISVLCAIAVAGRAAFFMLPQFKPVVALVVISGVCFGSETGFLVGAVTAFVSNFFFGQGAITPWQMFALGLIGFIAGVLFQKGFLRKTKTSLCVFGFAITILIYGGIMNPASIIVWQDHITKGMIASAYLVGIPFDLIHACSTAFFLWFLAEPMMEKLERIKTKYGLIQR